MLHNNAPWLPPHQQQQQQQPQQHPNPPQQQQQQHPNPAQQQQHPNPPQQQQVYASQMFQQQQQQPNYWPEEQQQQQQQLNYNNYFAGQQQPQIPQQPQIQQQQQQQPPPPPQQLFYPTPSPHQQEAAPLEAFDNNNSSRNDGWGDWGDWNETSNNSNTNNSTNNIITNNNNNPGGEALMEPMLEDAFTAQSSPSSWPAFANNNNNNVELPPPADQHRQNLQQQQPPQAPLLLHPQHHQQQLNSPPELGQEAPELDAIVPPMAFQNQPALGGGLPLAGLGAPPAGYSPGGAPGIPLLGGAGAGASHSTMGTPISGAGTTHSSMGTPISGAGAEFSPIGAPPPALGAPLPGLGAPPAMVAPPPALGAPPALGVPPPAMGAPLPAAPPSSVAPPAALPPSIASQSAGNPFKRSGTGLSKRVNILAGPAGGASPSPVQPGAGQMPPQPVGPPQAEAQSEGFNVLAMPVPLAAPTLTAPPSFYAPPPLEPDNQEVLSAPNDERAQYLQTSHLSEQLDFEADQDAGQLPPPGLSRLVLGQQELESQQQRLVTGATEQPTQPQAALHMEERLADGEDTSEGEQMPARHRVVTGVETSAPDPVVSLSLREQREVVMDGENLEDGDETLPSVGLPEMSLSSQSHPDEPESMPAIVEANPHQQSQLQQQQQQQQPLQQQQVLQLEKKRSAQVTRRGNTSLDLESDESDEFLQSERERDRERERERDRRVLMEDRRGGRGRSLGHNYTYDGETEDSVRGAPTHHETKSLRETQHHRRNHDSNRSNRRHHETDVDWERDRERERERDREMGRDRGDRDRERDRDRNWRRRSNNKYHSGGEDQDQRSYEHSSRRYNNSNYDGESDNPDLNHLGGEADLDGSTGTGAGGAGGSAGGRSSKTGRQDYDDYERERERDRNYTRRSNKQSSSGDKYRSSGSRRSYENQGRGGGRQEDSRRRHPDLRHWDGYEEYRRKSSRNSDLEKERTNGNTSAAAVAASTGAGGSGSGSGKRRNYDQYGVSGTYDPYGMYEQMSRNPHAYADMYAKFYGQMINSMAAVSAAAASKATVPVATGISGMLAGAQIPGAVIAGGASSEAALQRERERYTHAYINQANELHRQHFKEMIYQKSQQDLLNSSYPEDNVSSLYAIGGGAGLGGGSIYGHYSTLSSARSLSNLNGDGRSSSRCNGPYYAGSECGLDIRAATEAAPSTYGGSSQTAAGGAVITSSGVVSRPPRRRTPLMFNRPHLVASYAMSLLLRVKPKYAGRGRLRNDVEVAPLRIRDGTSSLLRMYPGPLQGRKLHKDKIISFCKEQIRLGPTRGCTVLYATQKKPQGSVDKYRASHALMWHLLILLLRQNGYIADTDVGDLLLENQQEYPYNPSEFEAEAEPDAEAESEADRDQNVGQEENSDGDSAEAAAEEESTVAAAAGAATSSGAPKGDSPLSEQAATDKFRSYVLRGNVEEALQWATDNSLWTHAFFLALYEDRYALTDVAHKFLSRAIKGNDPLQTLYQMKSCQTPACVSQLRDERWGDWRSHLSILVTNKSRQPEYDRSSVVALGDTLFQRGDIYAAHFCYLVAQEEFGRYDSSATEQTTLTANVPRLILLGASHYKKFSEFASNEAIIMTEIYEYARSLSDPKFSIATFQHYKFLLATRILDYGQHFRCTNYLEQIARHIELKPEAYDRDFVQRVCGLAERLRYHDPILINRVSFASPPNATNNKDSAAPEEKAWLRQLRSLADVPQPVEQKQEQLQQQQQDINQQFAEVNKQFKELNMQYDGANLEHTLQANTNQDAQAQAQAQVQDHYAQQQQQQQQPLYYDPNATQTQYEATPNEQATEAGGAPPPPVPAPAVPAYGYGYMQNDADNDLSTRSTFDESHQQHEFQSDPAVNEGYAAPVPVPAAAAPGYGYDYWSGTQQPPYGDELNGKQRPSKEEQEQDPEQQQQQPQTLQVQQQQQQQQHPLKTPNNRFKSNALKLDKGQQSVLSKKQPIAAATMDTVAAAAAAIAQLTPATLAMPAAATPPTPAAAAAALLATTSPKAFNLNDLQTQQRPAISMPKSKSYEDEDDGGAGRSAAGGAAHPGQKSSSDPSAGGKQAGKQAGGDLGAPGNQNAGWFGGLWNKLSLKPKNQMILPDDKNPTIVWDKERKCWTNTEGGSEEVESFKPPPKMSDLGMGMGMPPGAPSPLLQAPFMDHQQQQQQQQQHQQIPPLQQIPPFQQIHQPLQQPQMYGGGGGVGVGVGGPIDYTAAPAPELHPSVPSPAPLPAPSPAPAQAQAPLATPAPGPAASATATAPGGAQPKLQSNMFKMQRNRTLKNSYVDVFNPSGAPMSAAADNVLAPMMAPAAVPQGGYFVPGAAPTHQQ